MRHHQSRLPLPIQQLRQHAQTQAHADEHHRHQHQQYPVDLKTENIFGEQLGEQHEQRATRQGPGRATPAAIVGEQVSGDENEYPG